MDCENSWIVHTIGHSTRTIEVFLELLGQHKIELLLDVRRWPASRRYPHFNREALAAELKRTHINYLWRGDLGGFQKPSPNSPNTGWRIGAFKGYADFMLTAAFAEIMREVEALAEKQRVAMMCAEAVPWRCHRQLLADAFLVRGWKVGHIFDDGCREHKLPAIARIEGKLIYYSGP
jgi:uncharacterized protein (DUF488 family)